MKERVSALLDDALDEEASSRLFESIKRDAGLRRDWESYCLIGDVLRETGIDPALLEFEITETALMQHGEHTLEILRQINGMGLRLSDEIAPDMYNYGHFQVMFADGSLGWYEAGWGPMMSDTAFFVKDVVSPNGAVSIRMSENARSDDIDTHTQTSLVKSI